MSHDVEHKGSTRAAERSSLCGFFLVLLLLMLAGGVAVVVLRPEAALEVWHSLETHPWLAPLRPWLAKMQEGFYQAPDELNVTPIHLATDPPWVPGAN
eukprot:s1445_g13.t1